MLRLIEIAFWALGGVIVGVLAGYGLAALTRCPAPTFAGEQTAPETVFEREARIKREVAA